MSIYDQLKAYAKMKAQQSTAQSTADSSNTTVSKPKTTTTNQKSEATYWQATQQTENKKSTQKALKGKKEATSTRKRTPQPSAGMQRAKQNKYAEAKKKAEKYNPEATYDYSQANAGLEALFRGNVEQAMRDYANQNKTKMRLDRVARERNAEYAQAQVDSTMEDINKNPVTKAISDTARSYLGGVTSGIESQFRVGSTLAQALGGLQGDQDLVQRAQSFEDDLGGKQARRNVNKDNTVANNMVGKVAQSIGNMTPSIIASGLTGSLLNTNALGDEARKKIAEAVGLGTIGLSSFGGQGSEAMRNLSSDGELSSSDALRGLGYGLGNAGLEVATEKLSDFIPGLDTFAFTNPNNLIGQAGGEALEEMISSAVEPLLNPLANQSVTNADQYRQDVYNNTFGDLGSYGRDILESGLLGGATSLAMGAPANLSRVTQNAANAINQIRENNADISLTPPYARDIAKFAGVSNFAPVSESDSVVPHAEPLTDTEGISPEFLPSQFTPASSEAFVPYEEQPKPMVKPRSDNESVDLPENTQALDNDDEYIYEGEYRPTAESMGDGEVEYVPTGDTATDAVSKFKVTTKADPTNITANEKSYNDSIDMITSDTTSVPKEIVDKWKGNHKINRTAERLAEGQNIGYNQEITSDLKTEEYKAKTEAWTDDVTYEQTMFKDVASTAKQMNTSLGSIDNQFNDLMRRNPGTSLGDRTKRIFGETLGIQTDYDSVLWLARGQDLRSRFASEINKLEKEITSKGYKVESVSSPTGEVSYRVTQNGKVVKPAELQQTIKDLTAIANKDVDLSLKITNIGHNVGTLMRMFRTDVSPAGQVKAINEHVAKINKELDKMFGKDIKNGSLQHVKLNEDLVEQLLSATDDKTRMDIVDKMAVDIEAQVPHSVMDKLDAFRYNNLLFNPLTWIRNGIGNLGQSQIANAKDLALYAIESYAKATGKVRYNNLDMSVENDRAIVNNTSKRTGDMLLSDFTESRNNKSARQYLKSLGYDGALLNTMLRFKGDTFNLAEVNAVLNGRLNERIANEAKQNGYTVKDGKLIEKDGKEISDNDYRKLMSTSFKQARKQWLSSDDLRMAKADSIGKGMVHKTQREIFWNEGFDILNPEHDSVAGMMSDSVNSSDRFMAKFNEAHRRDVFSNNNPFGWTENKISHAVDYAMNKAKFLGDDYWIRRNYSKNMSRMLDAKGYYAEINDNQIDLFDNDGNKLSRAKADSVLNSINATAMQNALEDTYHDKNELAKVLNEVSRMNSLTKVAMNATVPFINTPMNIARRAIEYSPIGLTTSLAQLSKVKSGEISATTWLNNLSKGATGATAMIIGAWLASMGILRASGDDQDEDVERFEKAKGLQDYSIAIPFADGWSATVDWLAPGIAPFLLGAAMHEESEKYIPRSEDESKLQSAVNIAGEQFTNLGTLFRPIADTTMLSGLMETLSVFGDEDEWANELMATMTQNYVRQLTPVLGSKISGIIDPTKYSTSSDSFFDRQLRSAAINFRLLDTAMTAINGEPYLLPQLDLNGEPIETEDYGLGAAGRAITNLLNPATVKHDSRDATDLELERLYSSTGQKYLLPSITASLDGVKFTPEERNEYNQYFLPSYKSAVREFVNSTAYQDYDDKERASIIYSMANHFRVEAQAKYLGRIIPNADSVLTPRDKACDLVNQLGISTPHFYGYINTDFDTDKDGNNINNTRAMKIRAQMEADGIWDAVQKMISYGVVKPDDFKLNKLVTNWDTEDFTYYYTKMLNGQYDGKLVAKSKR